MAFSHPTMEMNLYRIEIIHDINLFLDGDTPIISSYNDSPFMHPEILPGTRVGRWQSKPYLDNYVELNYGETYQIKLHNYTWDRCLAIIYLNAQPLGQWILEPRSEFLSKKFQFDRYGTQSDIIEVRFQPEKWDSTMIGRLINEKICPPPMLAVDSVKETIMYVRLVSKRRYQPYQTGVAYRGHYST